MKRIIILFSIIISFIFTHAQSWNQIIKLTASDRAFAASFGVSVSVSGDYAVIGAKSENYDASGSNYLSEAGAAYVFKLENGDWIQKQKIVASDRAESNYFGQSVSIENDYIVVGAYNEGSTYPLQNAGAVYVFQLDNGSWVQKQKLVASERAEAAYFGTSVSIKNSKIFIGATNEKKDASGTNSIDGAGAVYVFGLNLGTWQQQQKIVNSDRLSLSGGIQFGYNLATDGNYLVVSTPNKTITIEGEDLGGAGAAYIFENQNGIWIEKQIISAPDPDISAYFGNSISISGDYIVAGAYSEQAASPGYVYIFKKINNTWEPFQKLLASDLTAGDQFGYGVAISGDRIVIGAIHEDEDANGNNTVLNAGSTYIFTLDNDGYWSEKQKIVASTRATHDNFGYAFAVSGDYVFVAVPREDEDSDEANTLINSGSVYVYKYSDESLQSQDLSMKNTVVYPNPTKGLLYVKSDTTIIRLELYNVEGRKIMISNNNSLDFSSLPSGNYLLKIFYKNGFVESEKIIKK